VSFRTKGSKEPTRILFGERTPTGSDLYARFPDQKRVFLVSSFVDSTFNKNTFALREKNVIKVDREKVDRVEVVAGKRLVTLAKNGTEWRIVEPQPLRADFGAVEGALERIVAHVESLPVQPAADIEGAVELARSVRESLPERGEAYEKLLNERTRIVSIVHISNALGTIVPVTSVIEKARRHGALVLLDGAQAVSHTVCDVRALDCDFYVFSSHKLFGPTGVGVLYGKQQLLEKMPPYQGGGDMIKTVTFARTEYNDLPYKFEAGTPDIAGVIGLGAAVDYVNKIGLAAIAGHERDLLAYGTAALQEIQGLRLIGTARDKASILSFVLDGIHPHDIGTILDHAGVAIRTGHHCAMPVMDFFRVPATARASLAFYNTRAEIDILVRAVHSARKIFAK